MALYRDDYLVRCEQSHKDNNSIKPYLDPTESKEYTIRKGMAKRCSKCGKKYSIDKIKDELCNNCKEEK